MEIPPRATSAAFDRLAAIRMNTPEIGCLRVAVEGGGCSGLKYVFDLVEHADPGDLVLRRGEERILIDRVSLPFLSGAVIDFYSDIIGDRFGIENPNATSSCGCGTSFSL